MSSAEEVDAISCTERNSNAGWPTVGARLEGVGVILVIAGSTRTRKRFGGSATTRNAIAEVTYG